MVSEVGTVLRALAKAEQSRPSRESGLVCRIDVGDKSLLCFTPLGQSFHLLIGASDREVANSLTAAYPDLQVSTAADPEVWPAPLWDPTEAWGNYLYDLGSYEHLLDDFSPRIGIRRIEALPDGILVEVAHQGLTMSRLLPLNGSGFTGALPVELAADFLSVS